jgi:hypothetical protein
LIARRYSNRKTSLNKTDFYFRFSFVINTRYCSVGQQDFIIKKKKKEKAEIGYSG